MHRIEPQREARQKPKGATGDQLLYRQCMLTEKKKLASGNSTSRPAQKRIRVPLSRERIEEESLALIEDVGIDEFSTRKLGQRLGYEAMSIYYYYPSKAHILDALADRVLSGIAIPERHLSPAERLRQFANIWRKLALQRPRFYLWLSLHRWNSEAGTRFLDEMLACFYDAGLSPEKASRGFRILGYYVQGAAQDESSGYAQGTSSLAPLSAEELAARFPRVADASRYTGPSQHEATFELGFGALLRDLGIE